MSAIDLKSLINLEGELWLKRDSKFKPRSSYINNTNNKYVTLKDIPPVSMATTCYNHDGRRWVIALAPRGRILIINPEGKCRFRNCHIRIKDFYVRDRTRMTIILTDNELYHVNNILDTAHPLNIGVTVHDNVERLIFEDRICLLTDGSIASIDQSSVHTITRMKMNPLIGTTMATHNNQLYRLLDRAIHLSNPANIIDGVDIVSKHGPLSYVIDEQGGLWQLSGTGCYIRINYSQRCDSRCVRFIHTNDNTVHIEDNKGEIRLLNGSRVKLPCRI